ncbi:MAG TPA: hypothetical protein PLL59_12535, partial [Chitinophagales bacterium]|nr:hypothetical protein [Chitinophagales bacterium]
MKYISKIIFLFLFLSIVAESKAQFVMPTLPSIQPGIPANINAQDPTVKEIFKKIEDTLQIRQGEIKVEEVKKSQDIAKQMTPRSKDADEQAGAIGNATNATEVKDNKSSPDKLLKEAQKASETVEKITATATRELREKLDTVDIYGFTYFRQKDVKIFNNAVDIKPPSNYILGVGDQLVVSIWGYADYNR